MTFELAAHILEQHDHQWRASSKPGHIMGRVEWTNVSGATGADWEDIELKLSAIRDWLGY